MENAIKKWWDSFWHISLGLNSLPGSCEINDVLWNLLHKRGMAIPIGKIDVELRALFHFSQDCAHYWGGLWILTDGEVVQDRTSFT